MSHLIKEVAGVLGITIKHATTKRAPTIGQLERSHASEKPALKIETGKRRPLWHKYVSIASRKENTSLHTSVGCEPNRVFHSRIPHNILDLKLGIRPQQPFPFRKLPKTFLIKRKWSTKMLAEMLCKLKSNKKANTTKRPTLQSSKKQIMFKYCNRKQIIQEVKSVYGSSVDWPLHYLKGVT